MLGPRFIIAAIIAALWAGPTWAAALIDIAPLPSPVTGTVALSVTVTGISKPGAIKILLDGVRLAGCSKSPCVVSWSSTTVPDGAHTVKVKALNAGGAVKAMRSVGITVANQPAAGSGPQIAGCRVFPPDNPWNTDISTWPVHPSSARYIASIGAGKLHPDFGDIYGIPFTTVPGTQARVPVSFSYDDESDPGPYPIPPDAPVEDGSDRHVLVLDRDHCVLYEMYDAQRAGRGWSAGSGAVWDLTVNDTRPATWTSADAAGLPILPGLVRYDEVVERGEMRHAVRFTVSRTQQGVHRPGVPLGERQHRPRAARHGPAPAPQGGLRHLAVSPPGAGHPARAQDVRDDRGRQRLELVHHRRARSAVGQRDPRRAEDGPGRAVRGRGHGPDRHAAPMSGRPHISPSPRRVPVRWRA